MQRGICACSVDFLLFRGLVCVWEGSRAVVFDRSGLHTGRDQPALTAGYRALESKGEITDGEVGGNQAL